MTTCPVCDQLLPPDARTCPACGQDLHARTAYDPEPAPAHAERDLESDTDQLLAAVIADGAITGKPSWVPHLEDRLAPGEGGPRPHAPTADVLPDHPARRRLFRRR